MESGNNKEIQVKHDRVRELLVSSKLDGLLFAKNSNFKWFSGGKLNDVIKNEDTSLVYLFITGARRYLIASRSDTDRVMSEELKGLDFEPVLYSWYDQSFNDGLKKLGAKNVGADIISDGLRFMGPEISQMRSIMTEEEIARYKIMCQEYTRLFTDYCNSLKPGITEIEVAAGLAYECGKKGIRLPVLMVGSDERIFSYRHPCATVKKIDKYVLIATVAEREGICANFSRSMYFGKAPSEILQKQDAVNQVEATYQYYSKPGTTLGELFEKGKNAYREVGYPDEWQNHLQGGISGYAPLEYLILEASDVIVKENNIMAWNPTVKGAKSEDPALITPEGTLQFTIDERWPSREYEVGQKKFMRPLIYEL